MNNGDASVTSATLDHHGLVAAACRDLNIASRINERIGSLDKRRVVQPGLAVVAMIINGLGFTNRRLYLTPQFFNSKAMDRLFEEKIAPEQLDDHTLGKALDEIAAYGATKLFAEVAFEIAQHHGLLGPSAHLDTTSFSLHGDYEKEPQGSPESTTTPGVHTEDDDGQSQATVVNITHGFSKDHRPDLKQIILSLTVTGKANLPIWMEPISGNESDKKTFQETVSRVRAFQQQLKTAQDFLWIADSALYVPDKLLLQNGMRWITRVPETVGACSDLISMSDHAFTWADVGDGYRYTEVCSGYGGIKQRWLLVSSSQAYEREEKTFFKKLAKQDDEVKKSCWHLGNQVFKCEDDAQKALSALQCKWRYHTIDATITEQKKHARCGRPQAGSEPQIVGYHIECATRRNEEAVRRHLQRKGRFILATNDLDDKAQPAALVLAQYKEQQSVEGGFRFLKDPWFMIDSFFLKSPRRIEALMMVMTLCLLVYNFAQFRLRKTLHETQQTIPNQLGKPTERPTLRWVFQIMEGIAVVYIHEEAARFVRCVTTNINSLRDQIIRLFGRTACLIYGIPQTIAGM